MKHVLLSLTACLLFGVAGPAAAYYTTDQTVTQYSETTSVYTIDYYFSNKAQNMYLPVAATRNLALGDSDTALGYEVIEDGASSTADGTATAVVVSSLPIVDGMYEIPAGTVGNFTLYVLLTTPTDTLEADYLVQVTNLPFRRGLTGNTQRLNVHELTHYRTPEVEFNGTNPSKN